MAGLDPAIAFLICFLTKDMDARVKPAHDDLGYQRQFRSDTPAERV
jgi:hypothetical protein